MLHYLEAEAIYQAAVTAIVGSELIRLNLNVTAANPNQARWTARHLFYKELGGIIPKNEIKVEEIKQISGYTQNGV